MSVVSSVSRRALAGSFDGSLSGRLLEPLRLNNAILERNAMLERSVAERQRHEIIACGGSTSTLGTPRQDAIREMQRKLRELVPTAMGDGSG